MSEKKLFLNCYDNVFEENELNTLLKVFNLNEKNSKKWYGTNYIQINGYFKNIETKLNELVKSYNSELDYLQIVNWPENSFQDLHVDGAHSITSITSITYLNDDFVGGHTYFEDGTTIKPIKNRTLIFEGKLYRHGVSKIIKNNRYTLAAWYKPVST
jgi:hypothetical protein